MQDVGADAAIDASRIAGELVAATGAPNRAYEAGPTKYVHHLRQMVIGDAVFCADLGDRKLPVGMFDELEHREYGQLGRDLEPH